MRPTASVYDALRDKAMHMIGVGTTHDMRSVVTGLFLPSWQFPGYTLGEKVALWRGKRFSRRSGLWDRMLDTDLTRVVPELQVPAYFLHGAYDRTVSYDLAREYAASLQAPLTGFYTFTHSAHSPPFEEPWRHAATLRDDVLAGSVDLADPRPPGNPPAQPSI